MSQPKKTKSFRVSDYYDGGLIRLNRLTIPSKRVGYKIENGILIAKVPLGVPDFEEAIRKIFAKPANSWPLEGRLLVGILICLPKKEYMSKDVDNMAKAILDAFKGIAYEDDGQIDCLFVSKAVAPEWQVWIALRRLGSDAKTWFLEPMMKGVADE